MRVHLQQRDIFAPGLYPGTLLLYFTLTSSGHSAPSRWPCFQGRSLPTTLLSAAVSYHVGKLWWFQEARPSLFLQGNQNRALSGQHKQGIKTYWILGCKQLFFKLKLSLEREYLWFFSPFFLLGGVCIPVASIWIHLFPPRSCDTSLTHGQDVLLGPVQCIQTKLNADQSSFPVKMQQEVTANWIYFEFSLLPFYLKKILI